MRRKLSVVEASASKTLMIVSAGEIESFLSMILPGTTNTTSGNTVASATLAKNTKEKKSRFFIIGSRGQSITADCPLLKYHDSP